MFDVVACEFSARIEAVRGEKDGGQTGKKGSATCAAPALTQSSLLLSRVLNSK